MIRNGYKRIVKETIDIYLNTRESNSVGDYMILRKIKKGTEQANRTIRIARAMGYAIPYKNGVYYEQGKELRYYEN